MSRSRAILAVTIVAAAVGLSWLAWEWHKLESIGPGLAEVLADILPFPYDAALPDSSIVTWQGNPIARLDSVSVVRVGSDSASARDFFVVSAEWLAVVPEEISTDSLLVIAVDGAVEDDAPLLGAIRPSNGEGSVGIALFTAPARVLRIQVQPPVQ